MSFPLFLTCMALMIAGLWAWSRRREAWGIPACLVLGTVAVWYVGDVFYNDINLYLEIVGQSSIQSAWWQVLWFVVAFSLLVAPVHRWINAKHLGKHSHVIAYLETGRLQHPRVQRRLDVMAAALLSAWLLLMGIGLLRVRGDAIGLFAPYLGHRANPWGRGQIGGGFSALISLGSYLQIFLASAFGVLAAVAMNPKTRNTALLVCFLTLPYYIFDRTRNTMLATVLPGMLAFVFFRLRGGLPFKVVALGACFLVVNFWFSFVMANRGKESIASAFASGGKHAKAKLEETKHEGLNMFEELAWIDYFTTTGSYMPNGGARYFAELVNPIPRALWKNKPTIGLDYAMARGQSVTGPTGEMTATISTGMIGQGVVNFGRFFGPAAAALLMALWVALLARQDLLGANPMRMVLYACGLVLTFNLGRDITLLVMYPFLFGLGLFWIWQRFLKETAEQPVPAGRPARR